MEKKKKAKTAVLRSRVTPQFKDRFLKMVVTKNKLAPTNESTEVRKAVEKHLETEEPTLGISPTDTSTPNPGSK